MKVTTTPRLSREIIELIMTHYEMDLSPRLVTALDCKSWITFSRKALFETFFPCRPWAAGFAQLLEAPGCTINPFIKHLHFVLNATELSQVMPSMKKLDAVICLSFIFIGDMDPICEETLALTSQSFRRITSLSLPRNFSSFPSLLSFICSFPMLEEVMLDPYWEGLATPCPGLQPAPTLQRLKISNYSSDIINALKNFVIPPNITWLAITQNKVDELPVIARYLQQRGPKLEHFEWNIRTAMNPFLIPTSIDFGYNAGLRSLVIRFLRGFTSEDLDHFTVHLELRHSQPPLSTSDRSRLDNVLANIPSNCLEAIIITPCFSAEAFPKCEKRGVLTHVWGHSIFEK